MAYLKCLRNVSASASVVSVDLYSAAVDVVTFTDASGARSITTDTNGHARVEINITPGGSLITFTSSVAKNPDNVSEAYTKSVNVTEATEEISVMPDGALYWFGRVINWEEGSVANGWTATYSSSPYAASDWKTNYIEGTTYNSFNLTGCKTAVPGTKKYIYLANKISSGAPIYNTASSKPTPSSNQTPINATSMTKYETISTTDGYALLFNSAGYHGRLYAVWYE